MRKNNSVLATLLRIEDLGQTADASTDLGFRVALNRCKTLNVYTEWAPADKRDRITFCVLNNIICFLMCQNRTFIRMRRGGGVYTVFTLSMIPDSAIQLHFRSIT